MQQLIERVEIELDDVSEVEVALVAGELSIAEGDGPLRLDAEVLDGPALDVSKDGGRVRIRHHEHGLQGVIVKRLRANVRLRVPKGTPVQADVVSAEVLLDGLTGTVSARAVSGDVTGTALTGETDLRTVSGDIGLKLVDGSFRIGTVSGDITISDGRLTGLSATSVSGDVMADLEVAPESRTTVTTVSGNVVLRLPGAAGVGIDLRTLSGDLRCELPLVVDRAGRRHLSGTAGNGSAAISATTTSGDVALLGRNLER